MSFEDWEPRALPEDWALAAWSTLDGCWLSDDNEFYRLGSRASVHGYSAAPTWRPWRNGDPVTWADFYEAVLPDAPEGFESAGKWRPIQHGTHLKAGSVGGVVTIEWPTAPEQDHLPKPTHLDAATLLALLYDGNMRGDDELAIVDVGDTGYYFRPGEVALWRSHFQDVARKVRASHG